MGYSRSITNKYIRNTKKNNIYIYIYIRLPQKYIYIYINKGKIFPVIG